MSLAKQLLSSGTPQQPPSGGGSLAAQLLQGSPASPTASTPKKETVGRDRRADVRLQRSELIRQEAARLGKASGHPDNPAWTTIAQQRVDRMLAVKGVPTGEAMQARADTATAARDMSGYEKFGTIALDTSTAWRRAWTPEGSDAVTVAAEQAEEAHDGAIMPAVAKGVGYIADPLLWMTRGASGIAMRGAGVAAGRGRGLARIADEAILGGVSEAPSAFLRGDLDPKEAIGLGSIGGAAGEGLIQGVGKGFRAIQDAAAARRLPAERAAAAEEFALAASDDAAQVRIRQAELERNRQIAQTLEASDDAMRQEELARRNFERQVEADRRAATARGKVEEAAAEARERVPTGDERFAAREAAREQMRVDAQKQRARQIQDIEQRGGGRVLDDPRGELPDPEGVPAQVEAAPAARNTMTDVGLRKTDDLTQQVDNAVSDLKSAIDDVLAADARAGEIIPPASAAEDVYGSSTGLERFQARQAARSQMLDDATPELPNARPEVEADVAARQAQRDDALAEAVKDPDTAEELAELQRQGLSRQEAESLILGDLQLGAGITPEMLDTFVKGALDAGKFAARHAKAAVQWALDELGDIIPTMRDFARGLQERFGKGIRQHIPSLWKQYKAESVARKNYKAQQRQLQQRAFEEAGIAQKSARAVKGAVDAFDYTMDAVIERVRRISPRMAIRLRQMDVESNTVYAGTKKILDRAMKSPSIKSLPKQTRKEVEIALFNGDEEALARLSKANPELLNEIQKVRNILDKVGRAAEAVGMDVRFRENFWPRTLKPGGFKKIRQWLEKHRDYQGDFARLSVIEKEIAKRKYGGNVGMLSNEDKAMALNQALDRSGLDPLKATDPSKLKSRKLAKIPPELLQYYEPMGKSADRYLRTMSREIAKRKMLGGKPGVDIENPVAFADSLAGIMSKEGLKGDAADEMVSMMRSFFESQNAAPGALTRWARDFTYIQTMGQIATSLGNVTELLQTGYMYGPGNAMKAALKKVAGNTDISLVDIGLDRHITEYANDTSKLVDWTFKATLLDLLERKVVRGITIQAAFDQAHKKAIKNPAKFADDLKRQGFGDSADQMVKDFAAKKVSPDVRTYAMDKLGMMVPVSGLDNPQKLMDWRSAGQGAFQGGPALAYQLATFQIRRLSTVRNTAQINMAEGLQKIRSGDKAGGTKQMLAGATAAVNLMALLTAQDAARDQIMGFVSGKDREVGDSITNAALQWSVLFNRYNLQALESGGDRTVGAFAPPSASVLSQNASDTWNLIYNGKWPTRTINRLPHRRLREQVGLTAPEQGGGGDLNLNLDLDLDLD